MDFKDFNLDSRLMEGIQNAGYETCTPVQEQVISASGDGSDLYVQSQTGTGKTAAYLIAVMQEILTKSECSGKKVLVLVPTRELAVQVEMECKTLCEKTGLVPFSFYGGVGYEKQVKAIEKGVDVLVATPGRIIDLQEQKKLDLSNVGFAIIDEADRMFDMGFYPDLRIILKHLP
ncbi:MAG: DEAD/DEAH box helicase, partial [Treponema sp.]|uniref:DEAD/DEAH box helicase n=1 Tax=Treponema sp. TaxID=166 RepID=UPI00298E04F1